MEHNFVAHSGDIFSEVIYDNVATNLFAPQRFQQQFAVEISLLVHDFKMMKKFHHKALHNIHILRNKLPIEQHSLIKISFCANIRYILINYLNF